MKEIKKISFSILYSLCFLLILTFLITILNYFNIINYNILEISLKIILFISFFIGSYKYTNKKLLKGLYIILINLLIVFILNLFKININLLIVLISSLLGYYIRNK